MTSTELKIKIREIVVAHPNMLASLDAEFGDMLRRNPYFEYREDEFLYWVVDLYLEMEKGEDYYHFN